MKDSYKLIFIGYLLLALKIINILIFQIIGILGYIFITIGLLQKISSKDNKKACLGSLGLFILTLCSMLTVYDANPTTLNIVIAVSETVLFVLLNWLLIYYSISGVCKALKERKKYEEAISSDNCKKKFMNLILTSTICINGVFIFPKLGAILFVVGIVLNIYVVIKQAFYFNNIAKQFA